MRSNRELWLRSERPRPSGSPSSYRLIPRGKKTMSKACDLAFSYNPWVRNDIIGLANFRPGLAISDPGKSGWRGEGCSILVWAARRQLRVASFFG